MRQHIVIREIDRPRSGGINDELRWLCDSLGLSSGRDIEDMSFKIMHRLLKEFKRDDIVGTERIAKALRVDSPRVNHHIRNFMEIGVVFREKRKVALRGGSLSAAIEELKRDSEKMFDKFLETAKKIDEKMRL